MQSFPGERSARMLLTTALASLIPIHIRKLMDITKRASSLETGDKKKIKNEAFNFLPKFVSFFFYIFSFEKKLVFAYYCHYIYA